MESKDVVCWCKQCQAVASQRQQVNQPIGLHWTPSQRDFKEATAAVRRYVLGDCDHSIATS